MLELYEVENGNERQFFRTKEVAKDMADWLYDHQVDGIPFVFHHVFDNSDDLVVFLNKKCRGFIRDRS